MLGLDLETTSADPYEALPVSFAVAHFDRGQLTGKARLGLINPGVPIPAEATAIHGITDAMVETRGGDLTRSLSGLFGYLATASEEGTALVGMNLRYDLTVLDRLAKENFGEGLRGLGWDGYVLDALVLDRMVDRYRKGKRNLAALHQHYLGAPMSKAHDAVADMVAAYEVVQAIARQDQELAAMDLDEVHNAEQQSHYEWATSYNEYRIEQDQEPLDKTEYGWPLANELPPIPVPAPVEHLESDVPISAKEQTSMVMLCNDFGAVLRNERLWLVSHIVCRRMASCKDLTEREATRVRVTLAAHKGRPSAAQLLSEARDAVERGWEPPATSEPPEAPREPQGEPFVDPDVGGASHDVVVSTMRKVMNMSGSEVLPLLKRFGLSTGGKLNDKRLRLYEFCCRERAKKNNEVEEMFA